MPNGYTGKILFVDLTTGTIKDESLPESVYRDFLGGAGLGVRILYERMKPNADPLGPDNILGFVTGPLTATGIAGSGRFTVVTKSPLSGAWAEANSGGYLGPELKWAGYDAVFLSGISEKPVYLIITEGKVELRDAAGIWGKSTNETDDSLQKELGEPSWRVACIGRSGENCSLMAGIINEKGRAAARGGVGAVMGSKRLKAIAVRGNRKKQIPVADSEALVSMRKTFAQNLMESGFHQGLSAGGTGGGTSFLVSIGDCPTKNWNFTGTESMPTCVNLDTPNMEPYKKSGYGCQACPLRCGALLEVKDGPFATTSEVHRPEYETIAALGTLCLNDNVEAVIRANEICNLYGMDTIAVGGVIAFAMECYENGIITKTETDGIDLTWGNAEAVVALAEKIALRQGFGEVLADGVKKAAERIGKGSEQYAMHVGGYRIPYHDPRLSPALGTNYISDPQPGDHMECQGSGLLEQGVPLGSDPLLQSPKLDMYGDYNRKGEIYRPGSAYFQILSSSGLCALYAIGFAIPVVELLNPVTGWNLDWEEGLRIGRRILTLRQAFNAREGISPDMAELPERLRKPMEIGPAAGQKIDFEAMKKSYFEAMGWDIITGKPNADTLSDLGLEILIG